MSVNSKMTAIADAIRSKTGTTDALSLDQMAQAIAGIAGGSGNGDIPSYHYAEALRVAEKIADFKRSHADHLIFGTITDNHVCISDAKYETLSKQSVLHGGFALETVGAMVGADFVANLGDNCWENGTATENAYKAAQYTQNATRNAFARLPHFSLVGNHDRNDSTETVYELVGQDNDFDVWADTKIRSFGYKDFSEKKVRVICLNTCDYLNASGGHGMSYEQKDFLMRALDLSGKSDAALWQILILSHIPVDFTGGDYNTGADLKAILDAYVNGAAVSITVNSAYALNEDPTTYATHSGGALIYNYAWKNAAKIIANVHGHVHTDAYGKMADNNILRMASPNTCFYLGKTESYPDHGDYSIDVALTKTAGTAKDTAVTFYCIDLDEQVIYAYGYGADTDRVAAYKDAAVYGVTYALTNVTSSNTANGAVEGSAFSATLAPTDGAEFTSVVVTMGGVDITATAYADGVVSIASVTGDIVITAVAEVVLPYTNLFSADDPDFADAVRFSSSGGTSAGSAFCSGYIAAVKGDVIRVRCPGGNYETDSVGHNVRCLCTYNSSKTVISAKYPGDTDGYLFDGEGFVYTITDANTAYIRVSGHQNGNYGGFIVTKNEEII